MELDNKNLICTPEDIEYYLNEVKPSKNKFINLRHIGDCSNFLLAKYQGRMDVLESFYMKYRLEAERQATVLERIENLYLHLFSPGNIILHDPFLVNIPGYLSGQPLFTKCYSTDDYLPTDFRIPRKFYWYIQSAILLLKSDYNQENDAIVLIESLESGKIAARSIAPDYHIHDLLKKKMETIQEAIEKNAENVICSCSRCKESKDK